MLGVGWPVSLPLVVCLGDSIRLGYQPHLAALLAGRARVWGPADNARTSTHLLYEMQDLLAEVEGLRDAAATTLLVNAGLHDLRRTAATGGTTTNGPDAYRHNVARLTAAAAEAFDAAYWLTTTPVDERAHDRGRNYTRRSADVAAFNAAAGEASGVPVFDLHAVAAGLPDGAWSGDGVHFSDAGYRALARALAGLLAPLT